MPIKVTCACGQSFAANDALAGKRVKCPKCTQPIQIPAAPGVPQARPATPKAAAPPAAARPAAAAPRVAPQPAASAGSVFDDIGLKVSKPVVGPACPSCKAALPEGAVLCVQCGYNLKLGRKMQTVSSSGGSAFAAGAGGAPAAGGAGGEHGISATLMERAARNIEEEEESERTKTGEGMPWYGWAGMLIGAVSFLAAMQFIPQKNAMVMAAIVFIFAGNMLSLYAQIRILIVSFNEAPLQLVLCLLVPMYFLFYIISRWEACGSYFLMSLLGGLIQGLGIGAIFVVGYFTFKEEQSTQVQPPARQAYVCRLDSDYRWPQPLTIPHGA